jgi:hypothetical protein
LLCKKLSLPLKFLKYGNKMINKLFTVLLIVTGLLSAQDDYESLIKAERERYAKSVLLSKIQYPGDSKIDITYYGLKLS